MSQIARNATASVLAAVISALLMFALYRFLLKELGAEQLGIWSVVLATVSVSRLTDLGIGASLTRFTAVYRARDDLASARVTVQTATIATVLLLALSAGPAYAALSFAFGHLFEGPPLAEARALLPIAIASFVASSIANLFQSALDGCQRYDLRAGIVVFGQSAFFAGTLLLAPHFGLIGIAWAQAAQAGLQIASSWIALRYTLQGLPAIPYQWRHSAFKELAVYGLQFQIGNVAMMMFEPLAKTLMAKFGGLSAAAYFEMANQFVTKARLLVVSANQVLVSVAAELSEREGAGLRDIYKRNLDLLILVAVPLFGLVAAWAAPLSRLWVGHYETDFVRFVTILAFAWGVNTLTVPAYFGNLGAGRVMWNTKSHIWMGVTNAGLGTVLGLLFGGLGVALGMAAALTSGSVIVASGFNKDHGASWNAIVSHRHVGLVMSVLVAVIAGTYAYDLLNEGSVSTQLVVSITIPLIVCGASFLAYLRVGGYWSEVVHFVKRSQ